MPNLGERRLDAISRADVAKLHASLASTPYAANGNLRLLSSIYSRAIERGVVQPDLKVPTRGTKKFRTKSRECFLTPRSGRRSTNRVLTTDEKPFDLDEVIVDQRFHRIKELGRGGMASRLLTGSALSTNPR